MPNPKHFPASQKAQIALETLKEEKNHQQIDSEFGVHRMFCIAEKTGTGRPAETVRGRQQEQASSLSPRLQMTQQVYAVNDQAVLYST